MSATFEIWNPGATAKYDSIQPEMEDITSTRLDPGDCATASFSVKRSPFRSYDEFDLGNIVRVRSRNVTRWEGRIANLTRGGGITVRVDGWMERLKSRRTTVDVGAEKGSLYITDHVLAAGDSDLGLVAGTIATTDFSFPLGIDNQPQRPFADVLEDINLPNGWYYGIGPGKVLSYYPRPTVPIYYVNVKECEAALEYGLDAIKNYIYYRYTADGTNYVDGVVYNQASINAYGRSDDELNVPGLANAAQALAIANVYLGEKCVMRPRSAVVTRFVRDVNDNLVPVAEVAPGQALHLRGLFPNEQTPAAKQAVNEMSTFNIAEATVQYSSGEISLAPGELARKAQKTISRWEARFPA